MTLLYATWLEFACAELGFDFGKLNGKLGPLVYIVLNVDRNGYAAQNAKFYGYNASSYKDLVNFMYRNFPGLFQLYESVFLVETEPHRYWLDAQ